MLKPPSSVPCCRPRWNRHRCTLLVSIISLITLSRAASSHDWSFSSFSLSSSRDSSSSTLPRSPSIAPASPPSRSTVFRLSDVLRILGYVPPTAHESSPLFRFGKHPDFDVVIDVGAFDCLDYSIPAAKAGYAVFAFELNPRSVKRCVESFEVAGMRRDVDFTSVDVVPGELPERNLYDPPKLGHVYLFKAGVSSEIAKASVGNGGQYAVITKGSDVALVRLDDVVPKSAKVFVLKSDTQGHEFGVLSGAEEILKRGVKIVSIEYWPSGSESHFGKDYAIKALEFLYSLNYLCFTTGFLNAEKIGQRPLEIHEFTESLLSDGQSKHKAGTYEDLICFANPNM